LSVAPSEDRDTDDADFDFTPPGISIPVVTGGLTDPFLSDFVLVKPKPSFLPADIFLELDPSVEGFFTKTSDETVAGDKGFDFIPTGVSPFIWVGGFPITFLRDFTRVKSENPVPALEALLLPSCTNLSDKSSEEGVADEAFLDVISMETSPP
jgi:hypothetical protein